ncbi:hypothetical protein V5O48_010864 [Marasmius crinis-equi]|uniref:Homeobox domain-containing protein n=1 Tax=Marasmius crinis-equi TaxID=585013 RepID=A0ABR3F766_9AGAR
MDSTSGSSDFRASDSASQAARESVNEDATKSKVRKRLTKDGVTILRDAFLNKNITRPTREQKEELLQRIKALPSCDHYTMKNLEAWFNKQRATARKDDPPSAAGPNAEAITSLETLYRGTPQPTQEIISIWVDFIQTKFKARPDDVHAWLDTQRNEAPQTNEPPTPTISESASPMTPFPPQPSATHHQDPSRRAPAVLASSNPIPPTLSANPYLSLLKREPTSSAVWASRKVSGPEQRTPAAPEAPRDQLRTELLLAIHDDLKSFTIPPRPSTREALEAGLAPYQKMMERFLEQVNQGSLKKLGFQPESR